MASKEEILINVTPQEARVAVIEDGVVQELHVERTLARGIVGNIYKGKVVRVLPGMQATFVDIGLEKNGFLHAADIVRTDPGLAKSDADIPQKQIPPIQDLVRPGESIWVQVVKDPISDKGARLTTELSIPSRNLVYLPRGSGIGISQKIENSAERTRLIDIVEESSSAGNLEGGFIIRTLAESVSRDDINFDMMFLQRMWQHICQAMKSAPPSALVHEDASLTLRTMRDLVRDDLEIIRIDSKESVTKAIEFAKEFLPEVVDRIKYYSEAQPLFNLYAVEQEIAAAMESKVALKSGGDLIIDQTEAMTTIDVNTGSFVGSKDHADTLFKTNLEAANEIAHQLRLRNLGGIIIIDFIDMQSSQHKTKVLNALEQGLSKDRVKTHVTQISPLGLVEITRKRTSESLQRLMCETCPACDGRGMVKTVHTVCYEILREILREDRRFKAKAYTIRAAPQVIDLMLDAEAKSLADLQNFIERPIDLQVDKHYYQDEYEIVLN